MIINTAINMINKVLEISDRQFHKKNKEIIKYLLKDNNFPLQLAQKLIKKYENTKKHNRNNTTTEPKIYKSLIYVPEISEKLEKSKIFDKEKYRVAHKSYSTLKTIFSKTKDKVDKLEMSKLVYSIPCGGNNTENCNRLYVGTTKNKLKTRIAGHRSDQKYRTNITQKTALTAHCTKYKHFPKFEDTLILNRENNHKRRFMLEMLQIINTSTDKRINFKTDINSIAQQYRYLVNKYKK